MYRVDIWLQDSSLFVVNESGEVISMIPIPDLQPVDDPDLPEPTILAVYYEKRSWRLPSLPEVSEGLMKIRYHTISHPDSWKAQSVDSDGAGHLFAVVMHATYRRHYEDRVSSGYKGSMGAMALLITHTSESNPPKMLPQSTAQAATYHLPEIPVGEQTSSLEYPPPRAYLHSHPASRMHSLGPGFLISLDSSLESRFGQPGVLEFRAYPLTRDGTLRVGTSTEEICLPLSRGYIHTGIVREEGEAQGRVKVTNAPCTVSGIFLGSEKSMKRGKYGATIWLMYFD